MRLLRIAFLPITLLVIGVAALRVPLPVVLLLPTDPFPLSERVEVQPGPDVDVTPLDGEFLLTGVLVGQATFVGAVGGLLAPDVGVAPAGTFLPADVPEDVFVEMQQALFRATADLAAALALAEAGFDVDPSAVRGEGAMVVQVLPGTPAEGRLRSGDVIVEVDGRTIERTEHLRDATEASGDVPVPRTLVVVRGDERVTLEITPRELPGLPYPVLGVQVTTHRPHIDLPVEVEVDAEGVGGPSGGLILALTVYDLVSGEDLAAGRRIAGTGAIEADGSVVPVAGVTQKVIASEREDVDLFLVHPAQLDEARAAARTVEVIGVRSFAEALAALRP